LSELAARLAGTDATLSTSLRDIRTVALQELIEAELTAVIGAALGERSPERTAQRNGHRTKLVSTPAGDVEVGSRSCAAAASFRSCWNRAGVSIGRCGR
jgi:putative transposase